MPPQLLAFFTNGAIKVLGVLVLITVLFGGAWFWHRNGYNTGYKSGYEQSLKDNPPNVYNGLTTVNQQPCSAPSLYGIDFGKWGFGLIHKK